MTRAAINGISPFFIVRNVAAAVAFYRDKLGFEVSYQEPKDDPFFAIVCRGGAMLMTDGLRGFELKDADGYVLFFGRPRENSN
jgi:catechol 2,3-dioxygenase-like lactoylglutathione lyase family enzyme